MKNVVLKTIVVVIALLFVLYLGWRELVNPIFAEAAACFHEEKETMGQVYAQALQMDDRAARTELICKADVDSVPRVRSCLRDVKKKTWLGDVILNDLPVLSMNTRKRVNFSVREHNRQCPALPIAEERL